MDRAGLQPIARPSMLPDADVALDFEVEGACLQLGLSRASAVAARPPICVDGFLLFRVTSSRPAAIKTVGANGSSTHFASAVAVTLHDAVSINTAVRTLELDVDPRAVHDEQRSAHFILGVSCLTPAEFKSLRFWQVAQTAQVSLAASVPVPQSSRNEVLVALQCLVDEGARQGAQPCLFSPADVEHGKHLEALAFLESQAVAACVKRSGNMSWWSLASFGEAVTRAVVVASQPEPLLRPRRDVPLEDLNVFELM